MYGNMLGDRDASGEGRTSRASNVSAMSRASSQQPQGPGNPDLLSAAAPGVMSMLRTSTEMGNVVGLTGGDLSGIGSLPRAPQRRGASSRLSTASSHSNHSGRGNRPHHRHYPSSSSAARRSIPREPMGSQYVADTLSPTVMNIPGSSPLVPRARDRDSHRSLSMTHTSQPAVRLSSNRSLGSLRNEQIQQQILRPRSPYVYPVRLRGSNYRSGSPAASDMSGSHPRRTQGYGGPGGSSYYPQQYTSGYQGQHPGQQQSRMPSDASLGQQDRMQYPPPRPSRGPSPVYYSGPRQDVPPMPAGYQHHIAVEQARLNRSLKGSMSSGSTNLRTDSDPPSSDMASPPTPKDGAPMESAFGQESAQLGINGVNGIAKGQFYNRPMYYDGSEQFQNDQYVEPAVDPVPTGFVNRYTTIMEERGPAETYAPSQTRESTEVPRSEVPGVAELPASPVPQRINRGQILKGLEPSSSIGDMTSTMRSPAIKSDPASLHSDDLPAMTSPMNDGTAGASLHPKDRQDHRHSILSQTGSSVLDSSTLEFAVRYSIPMASGAGFAADNTSDTNNCPPTTASPEKSTEDGMSELLAGYQHTESKHDGDAMSEIGKTPKKSFPAKHGTKRSDHLPRSSDEQSFKSCTDLPEATSEPGTPAPKKGCDAESTKSGVHRQEPSVKDSDARSFSTAKVAVTPDQAVSLPPSRLPSSSLATLAPLYNGSTSGVPLSSPSPAVIRKPIPSSTRESSFTAMANKLRPISKSNVQQSSVPVSVSGSTSTLNATQQQPVIPLRESSSSKEAQRLGTVASFLMRAVPSRRAKEGKQSKETENSEASPMELVAGTSMQSKQEPCDISSSSELPLNDLKTPERALIRDSIPTMKENRPSASKSARLPQASSVVPGAHNQEPTTSPFPPYQEPSSVYSPQDASVQFRAYSSPTSASSQENVRRESQTTTHLVWPGRRSFNIPSTGASEPPLPLSSIQENTTTDLRLSGYGYKYSGPAQHLPDLKEESHEDSSLNTSASNLKNSNFRFPFGSPPPGLMTSVDDSMMGPQRLSTGSHQRGVVGSALGQTRGLPSMHFSQMNLIEKLNEELGLRDSRSLEDLKSSEKVDDDRPRRPPSASEVREKFRSFVAGLDRLQRTDGSVQPADGVNMVAKQRARSAEEIIAEIDGLTIPSCGGLTQRISEMLPSLREYYKLGEEGEFPEEEIIIEKAMQKLSEVAPTQKRSSARLRPMPGSPNMVVINDAVFEELTGKDKEGASLRGDDDGLAGGSCVVAGPGTKQRGENEIHTQTHQDTSPFELRKPPPARLRPRSHTVGPQEVRVSGDSDLSSRRSLRSIVTTPTVTNSRPWNTDKNWPWASTTPPPLDISLPPPAVLRNPPRLGPSHLRNSLSEAISTSSFSSGQTATASPFGSTGDSNARSRQHRLSTFGRNDNQPHAVGERYPTSALTPPTAIFRDNFTPSDTSEDEDFNPSRKSRLGLRKRFSSARSAKANQNNQFARSKTNPQDLASPESRKPASTSSLHDNVGEAGASTSHRHTFRDAEGMRGTLKMYSTDIKPNIEMGHITYACWLISFEAIFRRHWYMIDGVPMDEGFIDADCPPCVPWNTFAPGTPVVLGWVPTRNGAYWESGLSQGDRIR
ncbi:hypothetical protein T440DRAFT_529057 [Plenodomus tracheiphilus IPT5]|uniref:Uncharacterized protein n=1 Tax=Plenodomus tracheiphilus IPT5 TaxID=1408161 RepID=A0A6A7B782_9PLEO|nr:hypothetical protein T440DRAFT_529057 [Plenodomus tracheiphilus IPT5]